MNLLTSTWRQLVRRRLWPVALVLVGALAAVPVLLARDAEPVAPAADPAPAVSAKSESDDTIAEPVVAKVAVEDRSRRRRVLGSRKNPFAPAPVAEPKKKDDADKAKDEDKGTVDVAKDTGGAKVPSQPAAPTTPVVPAEPAPKPKTYPKDAVIVRFGEATADSLDKLVLSKLEPLPDAEEPLLVYMGLAKKGKEAVFLVDESLQPTGDGACKPHPSSCEEIHLRKGETEFFDIVDDETGEIVAQYQLDLVDIK